MTVRTNVFRTPSLENTLPGGLNIFQQTDTTTGVIAGTKSLRIQATGSNDSFASTEDGTVNLYGGGVDSGKTFTISGYITLTAPLTGTLDARSRRIVVYHRNTSGVYTQFDSTQAPNAAGTTRVSVTFTVPANTSQLFFRFYNGAPNGGGNVYWDAILLEETTELGSYFDGSTVNAGYTYAWTGTAHNSTSTATPVAATRTRTNLVVNPSFEVDGLGWTPNVTRSTSSVLIGTGNGTGVTSTLSDKQPATAGLPYTASGWLFKGNIISGDAAVTVHFFDAGGTEVSPQTVVETQFFGDSKWERFWQTRTAPAGTTQVALKITTGTTNVAYKYDGLLLEQSSTPRPYFDGTFTGAVWNGTAHASTSTITEPVVTLKSYESGAWVTRTATPYYRAANGLMYAKRPKRWNGTAWVDLN